MGNDRRDNSRVPEMSLRVQHRSARRGELTMSRNKVLEELSRAIEALEEDTGDGDMTALDILRHVYAEMTA